MVPGSAGRATRRPRSRKDAAGIALLLVLLETALAVFLFMSLDWSMRLDRPARGIVLAFTVATAATFVLFGVSLLVDTLPVLFRRSRGDGRRGP